MNNAAATPGYNTRLAIWTETNENGQKVAYRWSITGRGFRMKLVEAETVLANGTADRICGHPLRFHPKCDHR